jgi:hypothetical protein
MIQLVTKACYFIGTLPHFWSQIKLKNGQTGDSAFFEGIADRVVSSEAKIKQVEDNRKFLPVIEMNGTEYLIDIKQRELAA